MCIVASLVRSVLIPNPDLQPHNILVGIDDSTRLSRYEQDEAEDPAPRKTLHDRTIYLSRAMPFTKGPPVISDLSEARFSNAEHKDLIMPPPYRAPEVILGMPWTRTVDIWGLAMVVSVWAMERLSAVSRVSILTMRARCGIFSRANCYSRRRAKTAPILRGITLRD